MVYAFGVFFFLVIFIVLIVMFVRSDNGGDKQNQPQQQTSQPTSTQSKLDQAKTTSGSQVIYTVNGSVVATEERRSIRMTVSASERIIEILSGYQGEVLKTQRYSNNQQAYDAFLSALKGAGFEASQPPKEGSTEQTACPTGLHYQYQIKVPNVGEHYTWATSCSRKDGTFAGKGALSSTLFEDQFPDYSTFTSGVQLRP
jgi:hypothetical protein